MHEGSTYTPEQYAFIPPQDYLHRPLAAKKVVVSPKSIDLEVPLLSSHSEASFKYEETCFSAINNTSDTYNVGPHLIDVIFSNSNYIKGINTSRIARPDAIGFLPFGDKWMLTNLYEFKSRKVREKDATKKVNGFSELLDGFRKDPDALPFMLSQAVGDVADTPRHVFIPRDELIGVTFASPESSEVKYTPDTKFSLRYMQISQDGQTVLHREIRQQTIHPTAHPATVYENTILGAA